MLSFAAPALLWGLLALPLVVLLHRLRVRRQRREVAGLFLWARASAASARRPRFHAGLLLLLQLLAVTGLVLGLARPRLVTAGPPARVLVVDASASMLAADAPGGGTRFDAALDLAAELAAEAGTVAVLRAGSEPLVALPFTDEPVRVRTALGGLRAGDAAADAERALVSARDLAATAPGGSAAEIHWLSDAPPPATAGVRVHALAGPGTNVGVTGFELVAGQAWIRLSSNAPGPVSVPVELLRAGSDAVAARTEQLVPARGDVSFTLPASDAGGPLVVRIAPPPGDALALDDVAHAGAPTVEVGLDAPFDALERALGAIEGVRVRVGSGVVRAPLDLRVLIAPDGRPPAGAAPGPLALLPPRDAPATAVRVLDWDRADPLLRFVDLRELVVAVPDPPPFAEEEGWTTLVRGVPAGAEEGAAAIPLVQRANGVHRFAFHPVRGDLTLRPAFPTLVVNLVDLARAAPRVALGAPLPAGATLDGEPAEAAFAPGLYDLGERVVHASLLAEEETRLPGPDAFAGVAAAGADAPAPAAAGEGRVARELAPLLAGVALALLAAEWWGFAGGFRRPRPARR